MLVFGDSFTFGVGIDNDHRYSNVLETLLSINDTKKKYEVLNFGVPGYSTDQEHDLMKSILKRIGCDLVIIGFCCDDLNMTTKRKLLDFTEIGRDFRLKIENGVIGK
ncbi:MAG: SGNH/GDSL hydrolase family protein, partial [Nitrospinota bacterium]|nr:SGNH/GDSL hydrolase family protein [Nitrospinota bacterium]